MAGTVTRILARDGAGDIVGEFPADTTVELNIRDKDLSTWAITLPARSEARELLPYADKKGGIVVLRDLLDDDGRVTSTHQVFSGPWTEQGVERTPAGDTSGPGKWTVSGVDDLYQLARVAYPVPTQPLSTQGGSEVWTQTGGAETVLRSLVDLNAGPGALGPRQVPGLTLAANGNRGTTVTAKARMEPILEHLRTLAAQGGDLGYRVVWTGPGAYQFQVYQGVDRSGQVQFSWGQGTLLGYSYKLLAPQVTAAISGGSGEGIGRLFDEDVALDGWWRLEEFTDAGNSDADPAATTAGADLLREKGERYELSISLIDMPDLRYGRDFGLLDRVTVADDEGDVLITDAVRAVNVSISAQGDRLAPTVGTESAGDGPVLRVLRQLRRNITPYQTR